MSNTSKEFRQAEAVNSARIKMRTIRHDDPTAAQIRARTKREQSLKVWLKYYLADAFSDPWSPDHLKAIIKIERSIKYGGQFAFGMPRGQGKTTLCKGASIYVLLTGKRKFGVPVGATLPLSLETLEFIKQQLSEGERIARDYPHVAVYAKATEGKAIKAIHQLREDGKSSRIVWSKSAIVLPTVVDPDDKPYPSNGGIIDCFGLTGSIRGLTRTVDGKIVRPDFAICDDPQTRESAESPTQCSARERIITGDIMGLAGPRRRIAVFMPCTIIKNNDLAARFLDRKLHPEFQGEICKMVYEFPDAQDTLWKKYREIYEEAVSDGRGFDDATEFYKANREAMDAGAVMAWEERIRDGEISALQTAENLMIEFKDQFWAEYQNEPKELHSGIYEITTEMVCQHATTMRPLDIPEDSTFLVGFSDINRAGLHWCTAGFAQDMTCHVPAYGKYPAGKAELYPENANEKETNEGIYNGLMGLCDKLEATMFMQADEEKKIDLFLIDRGFKKDVVFRFCNFVTQTKRYSFKVMPALGRSNTKYKVSKKSLVGKPFEGCHKVKSPIKGDGVYLMQNSCVWREAAQRAFLGAVGIPGGCTLHRVPTITGHLGFAEQVVVERLLSKTLVDGVWLYKWLDLFGKQNDYLDALVGCWVAGAACGLSASGAPTVKKKKKIANVVIGKRKR